MLTKTWDDLGWWSCGGLTGLKKEWMGGLAVRWHSILFVFSCIQTKTWVHITVSEEKFVFHNPSCDLMIYHVSHLNSFPIFKIYFFFFLKLLRVCFVELQWLLCLVLCTPGSLTSLITEAQTGRIPTWKIWKQSLHLLECEEEYNSDLLP